MVTTRKTNTLRPRKTLVPPAAAAAKAPFKKAHPVKRVPKKKVGDYATFKLPNGKTGIGEVVAIEKNGALVVELITEDSLLR